MKNILFKRAKRSGSILSMAIYRQFRKSLTGDIRAAKNEYLLSKFSNCSDASELWKELSRQGLIKSDKLSPSTYFTPNQLNEFFARIFSVSPACVYLFFLNEIECIIPSLSRPEFAFTSDVSPELIHKMIDGLRSSLSEGPDGISMYALQMSVPILLPSLTVLFNNSFSTCHFPSSCKRAFIRPLLKVNPPNSESDCRPVANLSELSKLLERLAHKQILSYLCTYGLMSEWQSGYRKGYRKGTQTALLKICHNVRHAVDNKQLTILVLLDFSKAFDTVIHLKLLKKLRMLGFGIKALRWIFSYLSGRPQAVVDNDGRCSNWLETTTGVPQGSVLGPLFFFFVICK